MECLHNHTVAPYTGAWIEILPSEAKKGIQKSHPTRVRGLKSKGAEILGGWAKVAPYTGAWIEIIKKGLEKMKNRSRTLHGCVD